MERGYRIWSVEVRMLHAPTRGMMQAIGFHDHGQAVKGGFKLLFAWLWRSKNNVVHMSHCLNSYSTPKKPYNPL